MRALPAPLLVITDRHQARHGIEAIAEAVGQGGSRWLLLRDKDMEPEARRRLADRFVEIARRYGMHLSVSRDVDLAAACGASVHVQSAAAVALARRQLGPAALVGVSAHRQSDVAAAAAAGADYVTLSPIFLTASKPGYGPALGLPAVRAAAGLAIPVLALGGVTTETAGPCLDAGARGLAVMGDAMRSGDPGAAVAALLAACKAATGAQDSVAGAP